MRNKIEYVGYSKNVIDNVTSNVVLHGDDINEEVLQKVCNLWSTGKELKVIVSYLDRENKCTGEEGEYIVEQLEVYEKSLKDAPMTKTEVAETLTAMVNSAPVIREVPSTNIAAILPGFATEPGTPAPIEKKGRKQTPAVRTTGKVDAKSLIEKMQEQIELIRYIDSTVDMDNEPGQLSKAARDILIQYRKDVDKAKETAVQSIQQL